MSTAATTSTDPATTSTSPPRPWWALAGVLAISVWPYLRLVAANLDQSLDLVAIAVWLAVTASAGVLVTLGAFAAGSRFGGPIAAAWTVLVWALFSHPLMGSLARGVGWAGDAGAGIAAATVVVVGLALVAAQLEAVRRFVAVVALVLAGATLAQLVAGGLERPARAATEVPPPGAATFTTRPDIWFIALDGLASNAFMAERTGYDAGAFADALEARGFDLQGDATSNYPFTMLSIASTLEMTYLYEGIDEPAGNDYYPRMGGDNALVDLLRANGYAYAHNYPGLYGGSRCVGAEDLCLGGDGSLTETEIALAATVPFGDWLTSRSRHEDIAIANDPAHVVERIRAAELPRPLFAFIHLLNPHAPLLRDADCEVREGIPLEFSHWGDGPEYADAVRCLHDQLVRAVDAILEEDPEALVVIQSDHGPRLGVDWAGNPDGILFDEDMHFSILSAMRLPDDCDDLAIPDDLTPVNTFRLVRACLEGTEPDLLPDRRFPIHAVRGH